MAMAIRSKLVTRCCHLTGVFTCSIMLAGCVGRDADGVLVSGRRTRVMLAAARANHVSMFGDLSDRSPTTFFSRTAVSLGRHTFSEVGADFDPDIDATGKRLVFASTRHNILPDLYIKSVDGVAVTQLTSDPASDIQPAFSPDGKHVAFASNRSGNWDIWVTDAGGGPAVQVTNGVADEVHPSWSPDGTKMVFCSLPSNGGQWELWITDAAGGASRRFVGYGLFPEWSPAGDTIVYQRARERGSRWFSIWTLTLVNGEPRYPTEVASNAKHAVIQPTWSPDGTRIAYASTATLLAEREGSTLPDSTGVFDVWVMNADGRGKVRLTDGRTANYSPAFSPEGRVFFTSNRAGVENVWSELPTTRPIGPSADDVLKRIEANSQRTVQTASHDDDL